MDDPFKLLLKRIFVICELGSLAENVCDELLTKGKCKFKFYVNDEDSNKTLLNRPDFTYSRLNDKDNKKTLLKRLDFTYSRLNDEDNNKTLLKARLYLLL